MDERSMTAVAVLVLLVLAGAFIAAYQYLMRRPKPSKEREPSVLPPPTPEELARDMQTVVEMGYVYDGPLCMVCRLRASEYAPITGTSWMDRLPLLNRLYSLSPRHVIIDNTEGDICFCKIHKQMAVSLLEQAHAQLRADRAKFNSSQEARIASLDGGEVLQTLIQMHREHMKSLKSSLESTPIPKLPEPSGPIITTTVVSSSARIVDEDV